MAHRRDVETANMSLVRRLLEDGFGQGNTSWLRTAVSENYVGHFDQGDHYGPDGMRVEILGFRTRMEPLTVSIDDLFECGDKVVRRFRLHQDSVALTRSAPVLLTGIGIDRLRNGMFIESWVKIDPLPRTNAFEQADP